MRTLTLSLLFLSPLVSAGSYDVQKKASEDAFPEVKVLGVARDSDGSFAVLLGAKSPPPSAAVPLRAIVIGVGPTEGASIAMALGQARFARPMTHDLAMQVFDRMHVKVHGLTIHSLQHGTYFARLELRSPDKRVFNLDCRPSDGIALAVRANALIRVNPKLLHDVNTPQGRDERKASLGAKVTTAVGAEPDEVLGL